MSERRYTDEEVARLLQRASDLDRESGGRALARGLSLGELREVAAEAGIDPDMVTQAAAELDHRARPDPGRLLLGGPGALRRTTSIPGSVDRDGLGRLVAVVDDVVPAQGTVGEALGTVRWTSANRFLSRQVVVQPGDAETMLRVEERYTDRVRFITHLLPAAYAAGGALAAAGPLVSSGAAMAAIAGGPASRAGEWVGRSGRGCGAEVGAAWTSWSMSWGRRRPGW